MWVDAKHLLCTLHIFEKYWRSMNTSILKESSSPSSPDIKLNVVLSIFWYTIKNNIEFPHLFCGKLENQLNDCIQNTTAVCGNVATVIL